MTAEELKGISLGMSESPPAAARCLSGATHFLPGLKDVCIHILQLLKSHKEQSSGQDNNQNSTYSDILFATAV